VFEVVCGRAERAAAGDRAPPPFDDCPARSDGFAGYIPRIDTWRRQYTNVGDRLPFDPTQTALVRAAQGQGRLESGCCYSACVGLNVAARADAPPSVAPEEICIAMPDAPSRYPSPVEPRCPAAVVVTTDPRHYSPFTRVGPSQLLSPGLPSWATPQCCYRFANDVPGGA
jgi:hypothetical protein